MADKEAQVDWDDDGFWDIDECYEKVRRLRTEVERLQMLLSQSGTAYLPCQCCHKNVATPTLESVELCFDCWEQLCNANTEANKQLRRELHDERVRRDDWEKMYSQAAQAEVEHLHGKLAILAQSERRLAIEYEAARKAALTLEERLAKAEAKLANVHDAWDELLEVALGGLNS